jgi:tRNA(fMet)-specific endonuclease VapC
MTYLVDTDSSIDYLAGQAEMLALWPRLLNAGTAISSVTWIELYSGIFGARDPGRAERDLRRFLRSVRVLSLTRRVMRETAELRHELLAKKLPIKHRAYDLITAATARVHDLTLVTSNIKDFGDIPHLKLLDPRTGQTGG